MKGVAGRIVSSKLQTYWQSLHGAALPAAVALAAPDALAELSGYREADRLDAGNVVEAAIGSAAGGHGLDLWEAFVSVVPVESLGNGDMLFVSVPPGGKPEPAPATLVWNHERDMFVAASDDDIAEASRPSTLPRADAAAPLRFARRSKYLVELLCRGRFDLNMYASFEHVPFALDLPAFYDNVRTSVPTGAYALWHSFFAGHDDVLARLLPVAVHSRARWTRDAASLIEQLLAGRDSIGAMKDVAALRREVSETIGDPAATARIVASRRRAEIDDRVLVASRAVRLVRDDAPAQAATAVQTATFGDITLEVAQTRPYMHRLLLRERGRIRAAEPVRGVGGGAPDLQPELVVVGDDDAPVVALWQRSDPSHAMHPYDGRVVVYAVGERNLSKIGWFELDVERLEVRDGALVIRSRDGSGYRMTGVDLGKGPPAASLTALPGRPAEPPASSPPPEIDDDRIELRPTSIAVLRGDKCLFEEPLGEAYAMSVLPARRMVAIVHTDSSSRPILDVFYVRRLSRKVKAGQGGCTWASFPVDGLDVELRSTADRLWVGDADTWIELDAAVLDQPPSWIVSRGWL